MKKSAFIALSIAAALAAPGIANADNAAFSTSKVSVAGALAANAAATSNCGTDGPAFDLILTSQISNSGTPKDLVVGLSAETNLVTSTSVASKDGSFKTSWAQGTIEMCVETVSGDGTQVAAPGIIKFDSRKQELWAKLGGFDCTVVDGVVECAQDEVVGLLLDTTAAHHFNFVVKNPGPGAIQVNAYARVTCSKSLDGSAPSVEDCGNVVTGGTIGTAAGVSAAIANASLTAFEVQEANVK
jgi:hypothetical protein